MKMFTHPDQAWSSKELPVATRRLAAETIGGIVRAYTEGGETYDPEEHGHLLVVEGTDSVADVEAELGHRLATAPWEGFELIEGHWIGVVLWHNDGGVSFLAPDAWLPHHVREVFRENLVGGARDGP